MDYKGLNANLTANPWQQQVGLGLHYGARLLPLQNQMTDTFNAGGNSFGNLVTGLPGAFQKSLAGFQDVRIHMGSMRRSCRSN